MPNESTQTMEVRYKRCPYCGGEAKESECGQVDEGEKVYGDLYSHPAKRGPRPENKMVEKFEDK